jgi:AraC-like DNA-binding protein
MNAGWWFGEHVQPVRRVARRVGYATPSAFVAAFRRTVGMAPGRHLGL